MTLASRIAGSLARLPPARTRQVTVERDVVTPMADGAKLRADRWYPSTYGVGTAPTVLLRSPYGRRQLGLVGRLFAERGYQVLIQSCRGTFGSEGEWDPMRNERADGRATLAWVADQPWFDGQLVTFGPSYLGLTQWAVVDGAPDYVRAMALTVTSSNFRDAVVYPGGAFALESGIAWLYQLEHQERGAPGVLRAQMATVRRVTAACGILPLADGDAAAVGHHVGFFQDWLTHETSGDPWWDPIDFGRHPGDVPPATLVGGWYDLFLLAQLADYAALRQAGRDVRLTVGPWTHASPRGLAASLRDGLEWFDAHVGPGRREPGRAPVRVFVMGADRWEDFGDWPPPADQQSWRLGRGGTLGVEAAQGGAPDRFLYDPADPTPALGGPSLVGKSAGPKDQRLREERPDVMTYTSDVQTQDLTVIGPLAVRLHLRSSLDYTDFFVRLCDVSPSGRSTNVSDGIVRLGPGSVVKDDDGIFALTIPMWPTANTFKAGHRVRLQVSSGAHPLIARNTGGGDPLATATHLRVADQEVCHDDDHPSLVLLPVVAPGGRGSLG
ncbi:MAG: CocE/NonD family hydrolase [Acidimicrobiales bacterium]